MFNGEVNYEKQLPWMTLYKSQNDLLQIRMVTTIGYVERKQIQDPSGVVTYNDDYEARFIKGFPLLLQSPDINSGILMLRLIGKIIGLFINMNIARLFWKFTDQL